MRHASTFKLGIVGLCIFAASAFGQIPDSLWTRYYDGGGAEIGNSIEETSDHGFIVCGLSIEDTLTHAVLVKTDATGFPFWSRDYGDKETGISVIEVGDGYILGGASDDGTDTDLWIMKVNSAGDSMWSRTFGGTGYEACTTILPTSNGGFALTGYTESFGLGGYDIWLIKTDSNGGGLWSRTYGSDGSDLCYSAMTTSDGGYLLAGTSDSLVVWGGSSDAVLIKVDSDGDTMWVRSYGGNDSEFFFSIDESPDGGYIAGGATTSNSAGSYDMFFVKVSANGTAQWTRTYGGVGDDECSEVRALSDGGFIASGPSGSIGGNEYGTWILRMDANGDTLWSKTIVPDTTGYGFCGSLVSDGGYIFAGGGIRSASGEQDMLATKIGDLQLGADPFEQLMPTTIRLQNYPNPFNPSTEFEFSLLQTEAIELAVFDVTGREVKQLVNGVLPAGAHRVTFDASGLPSGTYFAKLNGQNVNAVRKVVLLK